jgi:hypothetical protein
MKRLLLCSILGLVNTTSSFCADTNLWDKLLDVVVAHIKSKGPDSDAALFISMASPYAWARRTEMVKLVAPFLTDKNPDKVAGAIEVLYRYRSYRPLEYLGDFESDNAAFFSDLDKQVYKHFDDFREHKSDRVYQALAVYLGMSRTYESKRKLLEIAHALFATSAKEQALICLTWHQDPADMETLLPFILEDSQAARSLPYHLRRSYGAASLPYLRKAVTEAKSEAVRREAEKQLQLLEHH